MSIRSFRLRQAALLTVSDNLAGGYVTQCICPLGKVFMFDLMNRFVSTGLYKKRQQDRSLLWLKC